MAVWLSDLRLDCHKCSSAQKIERGCDEDSPIPGAWKFDELDLQRCPVRIVTGESLSFLRAYVYYQKGYLPNAGGWMDQSIKFIEAMEIIESEIQRMKTEKEKEHKEK